MTEPREFRPLQAEEIARAFLNEQVNYLFIGKSGAILLGYPGTTQDVDGFPNAQRRMGSALSSPCGRLVLGSVGVWSRKSSAAKILCRSKPAA